MMFREMRRKNQILTDEENRQILEQGTSGVLALFGDEGYPYALPISYVYEDGRIFFHSAVTGHKIDAVKNCPKASFCVIAQDQVMPEEYTTYYKSVIAFGVVRIIEEEGEKRHAIERFARKYHPADTESGRTQIISKYWNNISMIELEVEHMTGKKAAGLMKT